MLVVDSSRHEFIHSTDFSANLMAICPPLAVVLFLDALPMHLFHVSGFPAVKSDN